LDPELLYFKPNTEYRNWNVEQQMKDPDSVWNYYKLMIQIRKTHLSLVCDLNKTCLSPVSSANSKTSPMAALRLLTQRMGKHSHMFEVRALSAP
jgi:hypothetical protein